MFLENLTNTHGSQSIMRDTGDVEAHDLHSSERSVYPTRVPLYTALLRSSIILSSPLPRSSLFSTILSSTFSTILSPLFSTILSSLLPSGAGTRDPSACTAPQEPLESRGKGGGGEWNGRKGGRRNRRREREEIKERRAERGGGDRREENR